MSSPDDSFEEDSKNLSHTSDTKSEEEQTNKEKTLSLPESMKTKKAIVIKTENVQAESQESEPLAIGGQSKNGDDQILQFKFTFSGEQTQYTFSGKSGDSLLKALDSSTLFVKRKKFNDIIIYGIWPFQGVVNSWIPCQFLPKGSHFVLLFVKTSVSREYDAEKNVERFQKKGAILFYVLPVGRSEGRGNVRVAFCGKIAKEEDNLCILGFEGETIRNALSLDGRFLINVESDDCYLVTLQPPVTKIQFNNTVNNLNGQVFQIQVEYAKQEKKANKGQNTTSQSKTSADENRSRSSERSNSSERITLGEMQNVPSYMMDRNKTIISDFQKFIAKGTHDDLSQSAVVNFLKSEYQTQENISIPVKDLPMLNQKSLSVGYISNVNSFGTCFILKGAYILTCYHVVEGMVQKKIADHGEESIANVLCETVTVTFDYEHTKVQGSSYKVKRWFKVYSKELDYAVLELVEYPQRESKCLSGLLENHQRIPQQEAISSGAPQQEAIYIIGHPNGSVKKIDNSVVLPVVTEDQQMVQRIRDWMKNQLDSNVSLEQSLQTMYLLSKDILLVDHNRQCLKYDTCFFHGSSGSPVLSSNGEVVAMHCAGVGEPRFLFEFGTTIPAVKYDVLQKYPNFCQKLF